MVSRAPQDIATSAVATLLGDEVVSARLIPRGYVNQNVYVALRSGREALVKLPSDPASFAPRLARMDDALQRLADAGFPAPAILAADADGSRTGVPCVVLTYLPGAALTDRYASLTPAERDEIGRSLGATAARLHQVRLPDRSVRRLLLDELPQRAARARELALVDDGTLERVTRHVEAAARGATSPGVLAHRDLYLDNVIVSEDGQPLTVRGLIDFEGARASDPAREFVKLRWWVFEEYPDLEAPVVGGYLDAGGDPDAASVVSARYRAAALLECVAGIIYFETRGRGRAQELAADMRRRLITMLGEETVPCRNTDR